MAVLVLVATAALTHGPNVKAAANGKITGTVKLDGTAPHMKGIDMSKDPYCAKYHASSPAQLEWLSSARMVAWRMSCFTFRKA